MGLQTPPTAAEGGAVRAPIRAAAAIDRSNIFLRILVSFQGEVKPSHLPPFLRCVLAGAARQAFAREAGLDPWPFLGPVDELRPEYKRSDFGPMVRGK